MKLRPHELEFLAAWAKEEKAKDPYILACHKLQTAHKVPGIIFIRMIKAWGTCGRAEGRGNFQSLQRYRSSLAMDR